MWLHSWLTPPLHQSQQQRLQPQQQQKQQQQLSLCWSAKAAAILCAQYTLASQVS
jgi:hypothetical protein